MDDDLRDELEDILAGMSDPEAADEFRKIAERVLAGDVSALAEGLDKALNMQEAKAQESVPLPDAYKALLVATNKANTLRDADRIDGFRGMVDAITSNGYSVTDLLAAAGSIATGNRDASDEITSALRELAIRHPELHGLLYGMALLVQSLTVANCQVISAMMAVATVAHYDATGVDLVSEDLLSGKPLFGKPADMDVIKVTKLGDSDKTPSTAKTEPEVADFSFNGF